MSNKSYRTGILTTIVAISTQLLALDEDIRQFKKFRKEAGVRLKEALEQLRGSDNSE